MKLVLIVTMGVAMVMLWEYAFGDSVPSIEVTQSVEAVCPKGYTRARHYFRYDDQGTNFARGTLHILCQWKP